ncbi:MAG TPA: hypothetical protein VGE07_24140 [Herpetosiphonaceae bacterium]
MAKRWLLLCIGCCLLAGCLPTTKDQLPRLEAVQGSDGFGPAQITIKASTNCALDNEPVTLTLTLDNATSDPFTLTSTPKLDMIITPFESMNADPTQRWSETPAYPRDIPAVIAPGQRVQYEWIWNADPNYGDNGASYSGVYVFAPLGYPIPGVVLTATARILVGVNFTQLKGGGLACIDLPR